MGCAVRRNAGRGDADHEKQISGRGEGEPVTRNNIPEMNRVMMAETATPSAAKSPSLTS